MALALEIDLQIAAQDDAYYVRFVDYNLQKMTGFTTAPMWGKLTLKPRYFTFIVCSQGAAMASKHHLYRKVRVNFFNIKKLLSSRTRLLYKSVHFVMKKANTTEYCIISERQRYEFRLLLPSETVKFEAELSALLDEDIRARSEPIFTLITPNQWEEYIKREAYEHTSRMMNVINLQVPKFWLCTINQYAMHHDVVNPLANKITASQINDEYRQRQQLIALRIIRKHINCARKFLFTIITNDDDGGANSITHNTDGTTLAVEYSRIQTANLRRMREAKFARAHSIADIHAEVVQHEQRLTRGRSNLSIDH